jgi:hypothetical protein
VASFKKALKFTLTVKIIEARLLLVLPKAVSRRNTTHFLVSMMKIAEDTQE